MIKFSEWKTRACLAANTGWGSIRTAYALLQVALVRQKEQILLSLWYLPAWKARYTQIFLYAGCAFPDNQQSGLQGINVHNRFFSKNCGKLHCCNSNISWWVLRSYPRVKLIPCRTLGSIYSRPSSIKPLFWKNVPKTWTSILERNDNERSLTRKLCLWQDEATWA